MARSSSSRKPAGAPRPAAKSSEKPKPPRAPPASEAAAASQQGLLQLTFARHAHGYGILAAAAFLLNAILLFQLGSQQQLPLPPGVQVDFVVWLLPAVAGARASRAGSSRGSTRSRSRASPSPSSPWG